MIGRLIGLVLVGLLWATAAEAQLWSDILDSSRAINWGAGYAGAGTIPSGSWTKCADVAAYSGTAATINNAIAACGTNQYVLLGTGVFTLSTSISINKSNVVLRGRGPLNTVLRFTSSSDVCNLGGGVHICLWGSTLWNNQDSGNPSPLTTWTAAAKGATTVTLASVSGLASGDLLILDQANDTSDPGSEVPYVCDTVSCRGTGETQSPGRKVLGVNYSQQEFKLVTGITGTNVTFEPGLYMPNWRAGQSPGAWWSTTSIRVIKNAGVEDLTVDHGASNNTHGIGFNNAYQSWVKNVRSVYTIGSGTAGTGRNHVRLTLSSRITVRDSYFYGTRDAAQLSYGIEPYQAGDLLVENNVFEHLVTPLLVSNSIGSVFAYNYSTDHYNVFVSGTWQMSGPSWTHAAGVSMNLFEGNQGTGAIEDAIHGTHNLNTYFRNQLSARDSATKTTGNTLPVEVAVNNRFMNFVGNVLGEGAWSRTYEASAPTTTDCQRAVWTFGWRNYSAPCDTSLSDTLTVSTALRWGNYDTAGNDVKWRCSEMPTGTTAFANACPGADGIADTLPNSFYLAAQPTAWWATPWGTPPWPPIGPDVNGGIVTSGTGTASTLGGHAWKIPAQLCYANTAKSSAPSDAGDFSALSPVPLAFDATACYMSSTTSPLALFIAMILLLVLIGRLGGVYVAKRR